MPSCRMVDEAWGNAERFLKVVGAGSLLYVVLGGLHAIFFSNYEI